MTTPGLQQQTLITPEIVQFILDGFAGGEGASLVTVRNQLAQQVRNMGLIGPTDESLNWAAQAISDVLPNHFPGWQWDFRGLFTDPNITTGIPQPAPPAATPAPAPAPRLPTGPTNVSTLPPVPMPPKFLERPESLPWQAIAEEGRRILAAQLADDQAMQQAYNSSVLGQGQPNVSNWFGAPTPSASNWFGAPTPSASNWFGAPAPVATNWFGASPEPSRRTRDTRYVTRYVPSPQPPQGFTPPLTLPSLPPQLPKAGAITNWFGQPTPNVSNWFGQPTPNVSNWFG